MAQRRRAREQWRALVDGWPGSGLTHAQYRERHGVSPASFYRWREIFRDERRAGAGPQPAQRHAPLRLLPVQFDDAGASRRNEGALTLVFDDGLRLAIAPGFDAATLAQVLEVLRGRASP
ncbi:MAG: IS66 family insertion sequence element accessory protein TnpB [Chromatiaceae bacterium]|nr:IS66 family insertion sequence element accessory protein TnpB [Chromatiaceae bacterium]